MLSHVEGEQLLAQSVQRGFEGDHDGQQSAAKTECLPAAHHVLAARAPPQGGDAPRVQRAHDQHAN